MKLNQETAYTLLPQTHQSEDVQITDDELSAALTYFIDTIEPAEVGNSFHDDMNRHVGPESNYTFRQEIRKNLKIISDHFFNPNCSESMKESIKFKLIERAEFCTPGFHDGVNGLIHGFYVPDSIDGLLYLYRHEIVGKTAIQATSDIHTNNRFFTRAADLKYGIHPLNQSDTFKANLPDYVIDEKLSSSFAQQMRFFPLMQGLKQQILNQVSINGYEGQSTQFYGDFKEKTDSFFKKIFPKDPCVKQLVSVEKDGAVPIMVRVDAQENFNNLFYILNKEEGNIQDINWSNIGALLWNAVQIKQYYTFEDKVQQAITTLFDPTTDLQAKKTSLLQIPGLNDADWVIILHDSDFLKNIATLSYGEQAEFFSNLEGGRYPNVLFYAAAKEPQLLVELLEIAANKDTGLSLLNDVDKDREPLLLRIVDLGLQPAAQRMINLGADVNVRGGPNAGITPLICAAYHGHTGLVQLLLEHQATIDSTNSHGVTPLIWAAVKGHAATLKLLLDHDLDNTTITHRDKDGVNALDCALKKNHQKLLEPLLSKIATLSPDKQAECLSKVPGGPYPNVLFYAAAKEPQLLVELLKIAEKNKDTGLSFLNVVDKDREPLLLRIVNLGLQPAAQLMIGLGADVNVCGGPNAITPLICAAYHGHTGLVELLLERKATIDSTNLHGVTPLIWAAVKGHAATLKLLLDYDRNNTTITLRDKHGFNALDCALEKNHQKLLEPLLSKIAALPYDKQAECLSKVPGGPYPNVFFYAASLNDTHVLKSLVNHPTSTEPDSKPLESSLEPIYCHIHEMTEHYLAIQEKASRHPANDNTALKTAETLLQSCFEALKNLHNNKPTDVEIFKNHCKTAIEKAEPVLSQHRSWSKLFFKLFLAVITFPISLPFYMAGFFSVKTKSEQPLNALNEKLKQQLNALNEKLNKVDEESKPSLPK